MRPLTKNGEARTGGNRSRAQSVCSYPDKVPADKARRNGKFSPPGTAAWPHEPPHLQSRLGSTRARRAELASSYWPSPTTPTTTAARGRASPGWRATLMDVRNVHRALARLIEEGEIVPDGKAKRGVVVYRLTPNGSQPEPLAKSPEVEPIDPWRNRQMAKSSYGETARGTSGETARQTVIEQSLERSESSSTGEQAAVDLWNELAGELDLRPVQRLTTSRRSALAARLAECGGLDGWRGALDAIRATPFLRGENDRNWRASFDWLVDETNFARTLERSYETFTQPANGDGRGDAGRRAGGRPRDGYHSALAGLFAAARGKQREG